MRLLLIEDNRRLACFIQEGLKKAGFEIDYACEAEEAQTLLDTQAYDLLILDLGLPDKDGMELLQDVRQARNNVPVIILTARDELGDRVRGLNNGADDYLTKPFEMEELTARIRALLRRPGQALGTILKAENLSFHTETRQLEIDGNAVILSRRESDLLEQMMRGANQVLTKATIESRLYSYGEEGSANSIEVLVHRLRKKLEDAGCLAEIHTLRGVGYMLRERETDGVA